MRSARLADALRLATLSPELGYPVAEETMSARLARLLARPTDLVLVAESAEGAVVGWVHAAEQELLEAERIEGSMLLREVDADDFPDTGPEVHSLTPEPPSP